MKKNKSHIKRGLTVKVKMEKPPFLTMEYEANGTAV